MRSAHLFLLAIVVIAGLRPQVKAQSINLGDASSYAVLGPSLTFTGSNTVTGDLGYTTGISGYPSTFNGVDQAGDSLTVNALTALSTAYNNAANLAPTETLTGEDLGGLTLTPGVYYFSSSAQLTGTLTLNYEGNPNAVFVFQIGSTLTTASSSSVVSINGPSTLGLGVFWQVGSSETLGTGTAFEGTTLALTSITADTGATSDGGLMAENGAVTLDGDNNVITAVPEPADTSLLIAGLVGLIVGVQRIRRRCSDSKRDLQEC